MTIKKVLRATLWGLVYALPAVLFFSYHPVISLGSNDSMNFELSLPLIWLVIFDVLAFIYMLMLGVKSDRNLRTALLRKNQDTRLFQISDRRFFLLALFPLYATVSVLWLANPLRGLLTAGVMWLVFFAVFALIFVLPQGGLPRKLRTHALLAMFVTAVLVCKFCYAQSVMDILGVTRETTLLCLGCTYRAFGFPHPSGFAIEPQFMGNLLLAPTLTALYTVVFRPGKFAKNVIHEAEHLETKAKQKLHLPLPEVNWKRWQYIGMIILAGFLSMTLFFTFSRGAIYAYAVAILILLICALRRHQFSWKIIAIPVVSFALALGLQGGFAAVGPTVENFTSAIAKSIHQLSLGVIDLRSVFTPDKLPESVENSTTDCGKLVENFEESVDKSSEYVEKPDNSVDNLTQNCGNLVDNSSESVDKTDKTVEEIAGIVDKTVENHEEKSAEEAEKALEIATFEGYVAESTNIRLSLNSTAIKTWFNAPGSPVVSFGADCQQEYEELCLHFTPASMFFGVGLGGAGTAMHKAYPEAVTSAKEIVQNEPISLLLETGLIGIALIILAILICFWPALFSAKFLDGRAAGNYKSDFWHHPALPLLLSLVIAYIITLNFFSGLPNALQIYLMPPLLFLIFQDYPDSNLIHHKSKK